MPFLVMSILPLECENDVEQAYQRRTVLERLLSMGFSLNDAVHLRRGADVNVEPGLPSKVAINLNGLARVVLSSED